MNRQELARHKLANALQSLLLVGAMAGVLALLAWSMGGPGGAVCAALFAVAMWAVTPGVSPRLALRAFQARPIAPGEAPRLYRLVEQLAERAGLGVAPRLWYLPSDKMNAFSVGSGDKVAITLSDGLLRRLSLEELAGVMAHEVGHVANGDTRLMGFADLMSRLTGLLAGLGKLALFIALPVWLVGLADVPWLTVWALLLAPLVSSLAQLALSRTREHQADRVAAELLGDPGPLASALRSLELHQRSALSMLLRPGRRTPEVSLLRTHPPTEERLRRLAELRAAPARVGTPLRLEGQLSLGSFMPTTARRPRWRRYGVWW